MFEVRTDIKNKLKDLNKSAADLSRELSINYDTLGSYLNGRRPMPPPVEDQINKTLEAWSV